MFNSTVTKIEDFFAIDENNKNKFLHSLITELNLFDSTIKTAPLLFDINYNLSKLNNNNIKTTTYEIYLSSIYINYDERLVKIPISDINGAFIETKDNILEIKYSLFNSSPEEKIVVFGLVNLLTGELKMTYLKNSKTNSIDLLGFDLKFYRLFDKL